MKLSFNRQFNRYVISENGTIQHTTPDFDTAQRLMGIEPDPVPTVKPYTEESEGTPEDLMLLFDLLHLENILEKNLD